MQNQPLGSSITLDTMMVDEVGGSFVVVEEPFDISLKLRVDVGASVRK